MLLVELKHMPSGVATQRFDVRVAPPLLVLAPLIIGLWAGSVPIIEHNVPGIAQSLGDVGHVCVTKASD